MKIPKAYTQAGAKKPVLVSAPAPTNLLPIQPVEQGTSEEIAKLDTSWLPFAAKTYKISPNLSDYVIVNMPMMPTDMPNRNGISFPLEELIAYQPPPMNRQVYKAWTGCPVHLEHDNEDHTKAFGVVFDTSLRQIKNYGGGKHWMVYGLIGVDKIKNPEIAEKVSKGILNTSSMGCMADSFSCAVCGAEAHENPALNCPHITSTKDVNWRLVSYENKTHIAHLRAHGLSPFEHSIVESPAWAPALSDVVLQR
jgi:hypothetical protein